MGFLANLSRKVSSAERKIPSKKRIKSKMNNLRRSTSSKISNLSKKASNKFGKMKNSSRSSLKSITEKVSSKRNNAKKLSSKTSKTLERSLSVISRFLFESSEGSKNFIRKLSKKKLNKGKN